MLDAKDREQLASRLRTKIKKANSSVSTKVEAEKGDFKVVIASDSLSHQYKGQTVSTIRVSQLDEELINYINSDPQDAAQEILDEFASTFDPSRLDKAAKTAAHETQDESTYQKVTQKQLDDQKPSLHPRKDDYPTNITQKQLPEHGQRPGTYDVTTEAQFRDERQTFYGTPRISGDWKQEDRNVVTEGQFEKGAKEYSDVGESDRSEIGAKYDGGVDKQWRQIGEKQLAELLKHHEWTEPLTVTEGKDQLGQQDGELSRLTAETAEKIIKESLSALGNTVLAVGVTPQEVGDIIKRLTSHSSKFPALANTIMLYKGSETDSIHKKVSKAKAFGKTANTSNNWSNMIAADVIIRQLAKISANKISEPLIVEALVALSNRDDFVDKINTSVDQILTQTANSSDKTPSIFESVLQDKTAASEHGNAQDDGLYSYQGVLSEVNANADNEKEFSTKAAEYSRDKIIEKVGQNLQLVPKSIDVDKQKGVFSLVFKDANHGGENSLMARAEKRRKLVEDNQKNAAKTDSTKEAQVGGGGGMPPAAGPDMNNPMAPPGGGDMNAPPPGEALSQEPPMPEEGPEESTGEPLPPGSSCPACHSKDVDLDNGSIRCNNCGAEGDISIRMNWKKWPQTLDDTDKEDKEGFGIDEGLGASDPDLPPEPAGEMGGGVGSGAAGGTGGGTTMPNAPVGASVRVTPFMLEKLASQNIKLGSVCPNCGGQNAESIKSAKSKGYDGMCYDCFQEFKFQVKADRNKKHAVRAEWAWIPKTSDAKCDSCYKQSTLKVAFLDSLKNYGITWKQFDSANTMKEKAELILKMAKAGSLNLENAMNQPMPIQKIASARSKFDKFPSASCMERLSRKFGENATAMSGPCQGKSLAKCVCSQLEGLGIYTDGLAAKVASAINNTDPLINAPMQTCLQMFVKDGYNVKQACTVCDSLRAAYANQEGLLIEAIAQFEPPMMSNKPMMPKTMTPKKPMLAPGMPAPGMSQPKPMQAPGGMMPKPMATPGMSQPKPMADPMAPMKMPKPLDEPVMTDIDNSGSLGNDSGGLGNSMDDGMPGELGGMNVQVDTGLDSGMDGGMSGEFGDELGGGLDGGFDLGMGGGGDSVTVTLPAEAAEALQILMNALQGNIGDDMIDTTGDDDLDMSSVTDETDNGGELSNSENTDISDVSSESDNEDKSSDSNFSKSDDSDSSKSDIPGLSEDSDGPEMVKESDPPEKEKDESKDMPMQSNNMNNQDHIKHKKLVLQESENQTKEAQAQDLNKLLFSMKKGSLKTQSTAQDSLYDNLIRQINIRQSKIAAKDNDQKKVEYKASGKGDKIKSSPAQDATGIGKVKDGGSIGHEDKFSSGVATKPDVPRGAATLGDEGPENTLDDSDRPTVPHGSPAMTGEEHYRPEQGNVVDGNQGGLAKGIANTKTTTKTANITEKDSMNTPKTWSVHKGHQYYNVFMKKAQGGETSIQLNDGVTYDMSIDQNHNVILIAKTKDCMKPMKKNDKGKKDICDDMTKEQNNSTPIKESQTTNLNRKKNLEDDPDINQSSGPGKGKTHEDKTHSLGVDEKKPSEGMEEPSIPEAPNDGRLAREHTVDKAKDGPTVPSGGGMNPDYDQNEKNKPEKQDQLLGKENDASATASVRHDDAVKIAGQLLKAQMITVDELSNKINELSKATPDILKDYQTLLKSANENKGMRKQAKTGTLEGSIIRTAETKSDETNQLKDNVQQLFTLNNRNNDYERYVNKAGNPKLYH